MLIGDATRDGRADVTCLYGAYPGLDIESDDGDGSLSRTVSSMSVSGAIALVEAPAARGLVSADGTSDVSALMVSSNAITKSVIASAPVPVNTVTGGDVDGDGVPDLIAYGESTGDLSFFDGQTLARRDFTVALPDAGVSFIAGLPRGGRSLFGFANATAATSGLLVIVPVVDGVPQSRAMYDVASDAPPRIGDLDGDGVPDLVFVGIDDPSVMWMRGHADGTLTPARPVLLTGTVTGSYRGLVVVDLDLDGRSELMVEDAVFDSQTGTNTTSLHVFHAQQ
ncbi:MAG TPA: VCBS repeat-containing protein [Kofleriaceae bacterium]|nr:VCBS repeat-containing protein [Kofleriaceae bacterium]